MALTPNFVASQAGGTPQNLTLTDSSTGSDGTITQRRIYLVQADGTYLTPSGSTTDYIEWAYANASITISDILSNDIALSILVQWLSVTNVVLYDKPILYDLPAFGEIFDLGLVKQMASTPNIINDQNFFFYKMQFRVLLDSAAQAVSLGNDQGSAQSCLNMEIDLQNNSQYVF